MSALTRPSLKKKPTVLEELKSNSNIVKSTIDGGNKISTESRKLMTPLSKALDYIVVSAISIAMYKLSTYYL